MIDTSETQIMISNESLSNRYNSVWSVFDGCSFLHKKICSTPMLVGYLLKFDDSSVLDNVVNPNEYQLFKVKYGSVKNVVTGAVYNEDDSFIINRGVSFSLESTEDSYILCYMAKKKSELMKIA